MPQATHSQRPIGAAAMASSSAPAPAVSALLPLPHSPLGLYLVVNHISKKANVRTLVTSAAAFGAGVIVGA